MENTRNPQAVIDIDTFTVRRTILIYASLEKVWRTVTEPELISQWFGQVTLTGSGTGAVGTIGWLGERRVPIRVETFEPPREVSYRWCNEEGPLSDTVDDERATVFTFTLEAISGGTRLTVVETGFEHTSNPEQLMTDHRGGWDGELDKLVALLEDHG
ncbi:SRPBCC domain-containing protein [Myceligenerans pegani]|uniref:SRPBCC domain-containing protein n=1 Tax=Myceligenerans pegani TaxID=2776917 RepID=A0ABR9N0S1_9MICO|nr:SRPBCC domain-containing protein [Myceligenerans sp. TRM 65318]MBE1877261.1 SRPBCC domain-containing protein [Myceligenerans sp. TRM 65318]MBE3019532.1 SRPBCC domain-containing protein [Myceligenerans sp. TRM 65318]